MAISKKSVLRDHRLFAVIIVTVLGMIAYATWPSLVRKERPTLAQVMAKDAVQQTEISIGPNVHVSASNESFSHKEVDIAADPTDPQRLFASAISYLNSNIARVIGYRSEDGGKSWHASAVPRNEPRENQFDQSIAFDAGGALYLVFRTLPEVEVEPVETSFRFFRSTDLGRTWEATGTIDGGKELDRPYLAIDRSSGPFRGRLYCSSFYRLYSSADEGKTFRGHSYRIPEQSVAPHPSNPSVFSDGTVVISYLDWRQTLNERPGLGFFTSIDGGGSIRELPSLSARWQGEPCHIGHFWYLPGLAVGDVEGPYRDRLYAVWDDGDGPLRVRILFAYSNDKGKSWTGPIILSEQPADGGSGYSAHMPEVAVNKDGFVAVSWYDRRGLPDVKGKRVPQYGEGCNIRLRLSFDGGDTWQPSVQLNEKPIRAMVHDLRDHCGLTADDTGVFHPSWIDDRTGILQVWTAAVNVIKK